MKKETYDLYLENLVLIRFTKEMIIEDLKREPQETQVELSILLAAEQLLNVAEEHMLLEIVDDTNSKSTIVQVLDNLKSEILADKNRRGKCVMAALKLFDKTLEIAENDDLISFIVESAVELIQAKNCNTNAV